jgi:hypothetical protein
LKSSTSIVEAELERLIKSKGLRESHQLSSLLSYVVCETLAGRTEGLKEYSLGREVFHRPQDYDPRNDAIVRVQASLLRKRLAAYYEGEGKDSPLRIEIPRGGYVAEFKEAALVEPLQPPVAERQKSWPQVWSPGQSSFLPVFFGISAFPPSTVNLSGLPFCNPESRLSPASECLCFMPEIRASMFAMSR